MHQDEYLDNHILNIIQNNTLEEQVEIQQLLKNRGYNIPQATLSRRLKKLKIAKVNGKYEILEYPNTQLPIILNMQVSELGLIVLHTNPGNANNLAYFFDQNYVKLPIAQPPTMIVGTIAGDDTVLVIIKKLSELKKVIDLIKQNFPYLIDNE